MDFELEGTLDEQLDAPLSMSYQLIPATPHEASPIHVNMGRLTRSPIFTWIGDSRPRRTPTKYRSNSSITEALMSRSSSPEVRHNEDEEGRARSPV